MLFNSMMKNRQMKLQEQAAKKAANAKKTTVNEKKIADQNKTTEYTNVIVEANATTNEKVVKEKTAWECGTDRLADVANTDVEKTAIEIDSFETPSAGQVSAEIGKTEKTEKEYSENLHTIIEKEKIDNA